MTTIVRREDKSSTQICFNKLCNSKIWKEMTFTIWETVHNPFECERMQVLLLLLFHSSGSFLSADCTHRDSLTTTECKYLWCPSVTLDRLTDARFFPPRFKLPLEHCASIPTDSSKCELHVSVFIPGIVLNFSSFWISSSFSTLMMLNLETQQTFRVCIDVLHYLYCYCGELWKL